MKTIGTFKIESGMAHVSDPCYAKNKFAFLHPAVNGVWVAQVSTSKSKGIASITARLKGTKGNNWFKLDTGGVDSGQMGIFDHKFYRNDNEAGTIPMPKWLDAKWKKGEPKGSNFYGACCTLTCSNFSAGILPHGAVSSSGHGDGVYPIYVQTNSHGIATGFQVRF